jgi:predicted double-glycine peptidase
MELGEVMGTDPELGTTNHAFLETAKGFGFETIVKTEGTFEDLAEWIDKKVPVVVDWFTPGRKDYDEGEMPDGHYSLVVGLDDEHVYLQDPEIGGLRTIQRKQFWRVWFDFEQDWITHKDDMVLRWMAAVYPKDRRV